MIDVAFYDPETEEELHRENGLHRDFARESIDEILEENGWTEL